MGRQQIPGIYREEGRGWCVDKIVKGKRLRHSGSGTKEEAEGWLIDELGRLNHAPQAASQGPVRRTFDEAAGHFVRIYGSKPSINEDVKHLAWLTPFIGSLYLDQIYDATLKPFVDARLKDGCKSQTINLSLCRVRHILNLAARSWRDDEGKTWLPSPPLLSMVEGGDEREPVQLTWKQQRDHLSKLPDHLARMALFDLQCGVRSAVLCGLRWDWEIRIPELDNVSVFSVPRPSVKGRQGKKRARLLVCNSVAQSIVEDQRGLHSAFVFPYSQSTKKPRYRKLERMLNSGWLDWREDCGLGDFHPHDLRHTVGMRLREAGVREETRSDILWHVRKGMPQHYAVAQIVEIRNAVELITDERHGFNKSLASIARDALPVPALSPRTKTA